MDKLQETRALSFVKTRASLEAIALASELHPEHLFLGLLKLAEVTANDISPNSRYYEQTAADIEQVSTQLKEAGIESFKKVRDQLRRILSNEIPSGNGKALLDELNGKMLSKAGNETLSSAHLLSVLLETPTPMLAMVLRAGKPDENAAPDKPPEPQLEGIPFLPSLTGRVRKMRYALLDKVHGQDHAVHAFAEGMFNAEVLAAADEKRRRPRAVFVFAGPPGVGKTFLAGQAAEALNIAYKRFDMSNFADHQAHSNLIGFNPSYKDAKAGILTRFVRTNPHSILLFDEIEKAHLNTIQLFLQILDAGILHDDFLDEDVLFRDTVIIFTTNAGRRLYEGDFKSNAAGLSRQTILGALETDIHPNTGLPYFPAAICSRMATGYPMMFNHLQAHHLEKISAGEFHRLCSLFEKQYGIHIVVDDLLASILLFAEGGHADARTLCARTELFFKNELFKLFRLWDTELENALKQMQDIHFSMELNDMPEEVKRLFNNPERREILFFGNLACAEKLRNALPQIEIHHADKAAEAFEILSEKDILFVIMELSVDAKKPFDPMATVAESPVAASAPTSTISAFVYTPPGASSLKTARNFFKTLHERLPDMPVYLVETEKFSIDDELLAAFVHAGVRGKLTLPQNNWDVLTEEITAICIHAGMQNVAAELTLQRKMLSFETAPIISPDKKHATIRLRDFSLRRQIAADDNRDVLDEIEKPDTRFDDVIGADDAKIELKTFIDFLKNPKKASAAGYRLPKGVLLYGPPGTGKTMLARAMAGESDIAFIPASATSFVTRWQGSGQESVRTLFARARRYAPAIIFIDEIDAIGRTRGTGVSGHGEEMALNALLTEMDGFDVDPKRPVFVLAATNFNVEEGHAEAKSIDPALARRFDRRIFVDLPNKDGRKRYLSISLAKRPNQVSGTMIQLLSERSAGCSLADLASVLELAFRTAGKNNCLLDDEIIEEAFEINRHGEKRNWGKDTLLRVARHEAGHACLCFLAGRTPAYLTIVARGDHGGYMEHAGDEDNPLKTRNELLARIRTALGGRASEIVYYGDVDGISTGAAGDLQSATRIARSMICSCGMDNETGPVYLSDDEATRGPLAGKIAERISVIIRQELAQTIEILHENRHLVDKLVEQLMEKNKLTKDEMEEIFKSANK
jgi:ATP-dependent metalloprotease FtsH